MLLKKLQTTFLAKKRIPEPYKEIIPSESIARFLTHKKKEFDEKENIVRPAAFILRESDKGKMSVARIDQLSDEGIIQVDKEISPARKSSLKAIAKIIAQDVFDLSLMLEPDLSNNAHVRHASITGFVFSADSKALMESIELAKKSQLILLKNS